MLLWCLPLSAALTAPTYAQLADKAMSLSSGWIGIAGGPGAGKSTVAEGVAQCCRDNGVPAVVLPMDGYHYTRAKLRELDPPDATDYMARRGAPHTFDAEAFVADLTLAKRRGWAELPTYSRELSDPVPGGASLDSSHRLVFIEGNYLFLETLEDDQARRWAGLLELFDARWFVQARGGVPEQRRRLVERHLKTWTDAKTKAWQATSPREGATKRADFNDVPNAYLVERTRDVADLLIETF